MGERTFFQIAVVLIPLLTFGGLLVSSVRDEDRHWPPPIATREIFEACGLLLLGLLAILAETIAVKSAVTGEASSGDRLVVIAMILIGMVAIVLRATVPRFVRLGRLFHGARSGTRYMGMLIATFSVIVGLGITSAFLLDGAIRLGETRASMKQIDQVEVQIEASYRRLDALDRRENALLLKASRSAGGKPRSPSESLRQRILANELRSIFRAEKVEWARMERLLDEQKILYEEALR